MVSYKRVPVLGKDDVVRNVRVRSDHLDQYQRQVVNQHGKLAYVKLDSQQRAVRIVRGSGRRLVRVKFTTRIDYKPSRQATDTEDFQNQKKRTPLHQEVSVVAVVPEDEVEDILADFTAWRQEIADESYGGLDVVGGIAWRRPAIDAPEGIELITGGIGPKKSSLKDLPQRAVDNVQAWWDERGDDLIGEGAEPSPDDRKARVLRAEQRTDKNGRRYWVDPVTGRRTVDPTLVRELRG